MATTTIVVSDRPIASMTVEEIMEEFRRTATEMSILSVRRRDLSVAIDASKKNRAVQINVDRLSPEEQRLMLAELHRRLDP